MTILSFIPRNGLRCRNGVNTTFNYLISVDDIDLINFIIRRTKIFHTVEKGFNVCLQHIIIPLLEPHVTSISFYNIQEKDTNMQKVAANNVQQMNNRTQSIRSQSPSMTNDDICNMNHK